MKSAEQIEVYCLTAPNGKQYVGVTNRFARRLRRHQQSDTPIGRSIRKYGLGSFRVVSLMRTGDRSEALRIERIEIERLSTIVPNGYNVTQGGMGGGVMGRPCRIETREKIAESLRGRKNGPHSEETKRKMREAHRGQSIRTRRKLAAAAKKHWAKIPADKRRELTASARAVANGG